MNYSTFYIKAFLAAFLLLSGTSLYAADQRSDLQNIQVLIEQTKAQLSKNLENFERIQQQIKLAELEIAKTSVETKRTRTEISDINKEIARLGKEQSTLQQQIQNQQGLLSEQIRSAFLAGNNDYLKMLFNQEQASQLERVFVYYNYMNNARQSKIDEFKGVIAELIQISEQLKSRKQTLAVLRERQVEQERRLKRQQQDRLASVDKLNQMIETDQGRVARLEQQERNLMQAIEKAERSAEKLRKQQKSSRQLAGLTAKRGQLIMPTSGTMRSLFGKRRQGLVTWKGVVFNTPAGTPVNVVDDGKVLYADWLKGFGLVIIVDHGEGYMSVYGHNQALLRSVGDYVSKGDGISLVGASGGQGASGLYFEIRHKGKALNPAQWLRRG